MGRGRLMRMNYALRAASPCKRSSPFSFGGPAFLQRGGLLQATSEGSSTDLDAVAGRRPPPLPPVRRLKTPSPGRLSRPCADFSGDLQKS